MSCFILKVNDFRTNKVVEGSIDGLLNKIQAVVETKKFFGEWLSASKDSTGNEQFFQRIGAEKTDEMSDDEFEQEVKERADDYLDELWWDFHSEFKRHAKTEGNNLVGYRCIAVEDVEEFVKALNKGKYLQGYSGVGIFFSWKKEAAECHWGNDSETVVVKALIPFTSIDIKRTARANFDIDLGQDENEITLKKGAKLRVVEILDGDNNNLLEGLKSLPVVANNQYLRKLEAHIYETDQHF